MCCANPFVLSAGLSSRSISWSNDQTIPEVIEVSVIPAGQPQDFPDLATYVGGLQSQSVLLTNETNSISFNLVPSYAVGLSQPVMYRANGPRAG